jgi:hypothetical protein
VEEHNVDIGRSGMTEVRVGERGGGMGIGSDKRSRIKGQE